MNIVKDYMDQFKILSNMVMVVKQLLKVNGFNDPYSGGISSYALTLMIVAFLQFQIINCSGEMYHPFYNHYTPYHDDLAYTLIQFLHFYSFTVQFSSSYIHPCNPGDFSHNTVYTNFHMDEKLMIIDPLNSNNNVGKSSFNIDYIKSCFQKSYNILSSTGPYNAETYEEWKKVLTV